MNELFTHTIQIQKRLQEFILAHREKFAQTGSWGTDVVDRFATFAGKGKMVRGNSIVTSFLFCKDTTNISPAIDTAVSIELIHASLLIHDDIMDNDQTRRGEDSLFFQYQKLLKQQGISNYEELGKSLALCVGDIGFFLAYQVLNELDIDTKIRQRILEKVSVELPFVGIGQMQDIIDLQEFSEQSILQTYRYKTARYTFSLPFSLGALLAGKESIVEKFEIFGEELGIIFQLKDDELGMFGTEKEIGKKVGSDIREGKKTFYYLHLLEQANEEEKQQLQTIWGNKEILENDLIFIHELINKYSISKKINDFVNAHLSRLEKILEELPISKENKQQLQEFISYNIARNK